MFSERAVSWNLRKTEEETFVVKKSMKSGSSAESGVNWFETIHSLAGSVRTFTFTECIIVF